VPTQRRPNVLSELGFTVRRRGDELHGWAAVVPEMLVPGTTSLRLSILATWVDTLTGLLTVGVVQPRVPATLQLDVNLHRPPTDVAEVHAWARIVKAGQGAVVATVDLHDAHHSRFGGGTGLFTTAGDPELRMAADLDELVADMGAPRGRLSAPFAERAGCRRVRPGVASIDCAAERSNASGTLNGGLIALAVEEAVLSERPGDSLAMLTLRYLRPVRVGPARATASSHGDLADVEVVDAGRDEVLSVLATTRTFGRRPGA
jgi:acyl-coenzyme A thioesterase PaaI-like protein